MKRKFEVLIKVDTLAFVLVFFLGWGFVYGWNMAKWHIIPNCPPDPYPADGVTYYEYDVIGNDTIPKDTIWYPSRIILKSISHEEN